MLRGHMLASLRQCRDDIKPSRFAEVYRCAMATLTLRFTSPAHSSAGADRTLSSSFPRKFRENGGKPLRNVPKMIGSFSLFLPFDLSAHSTRCNRQPRSALRTHRRQRVNVKFPTADHLVLTLCSGPSPTYLRHGQQVIVSLSQELLERQTLLKPGYMRSIDHSPEQLREHNSPFLSLSIFAHLPRDRTRPSAGKQLRV